MRGAQINTNRDAPLVRIRGLSGFGDLQKRHENLVFYVVKPAERKVLRKEVAPLLSQLIPTTLDIVGKSRNEHEGSDLFCSAGVIALLVDQLPAKRQGLA